MCGHLEQGWKVNEVGHGGYRDGDEHGDAVDLRCRQAELDLRTQGCAWTCA